MPRNPARDLAVAQELRDRLAGKVERAQAALDSAVAALADADAAVSELEGADVAVGADTAAATAAGGSD